MVASEVAKSFRPMSHLVFGANTDTGKTIISAGLARSALLGSFHGSKNVDTALVNYTKPLQCGGSDESFVRKVVDALRKNGSILHGQFESQTLFKWVTPASPHYASRLEQKPISDNEIIKSVLTNLHNFEIRCIEENKQGIQFIETAGGVMSPASSSPQNKNSTHARSSTRPRNSLDGPREGFWGWSTQADLYASLKLPVVLIGDGKLGGISCTLTALEALVCRGYKVNAIIFLRSHTDTSVASINKVASQEFLQTR